LSRIDFNRGWEFAKSDAEWADDFIAEGQASLVVRPALTGVAEDSAMENVILPHTWNAEDMLPGGTSPYVGPGWYRKAFVAPELEPGSRLLLEFEGVTNCHKAWVNGGYAGGRDGGFLTTFMDVTELLIDGENTVLVRADNSYGFRAAMPRNIDWNRYGGITRPVWMHVREHAYLACAGVEVRTPEVSAERARTVVRAHVEETSLGGTSLEVRHTLVSPNGEMVSTTVTLMKTRYSLTNTVEVELPPVENPELWSDVTPALYTLRTEIVEDGRVIDSEERRVGYRFYSFDADKGFSLNGRPTKLRGANIHIFFPGLGNALPERFHIDDMRLMKDMGCNYMRTSHYPRPKACLDACDELGIMVLEEQPYWHGSLRAPGGEAAIENAGVIVRDMVRHHGSHPCIIAWNTVNEIMLAPAYKPGVGHLEPGDPRREAWKINPKEYPYIRRHLQRMVDAFKDADPDRPVSMVVGGGWQKNDDAGLTSMADIVAYNGGAMNLTDDFTGPETGKPYEFRPDYYRELYPERVHIMSEGVLNDVTFERGDWAREERAWRRSARYWSVMYERPWFSGGSMWCFTDYSANGEIRLHGAVDRHRLPKDLYRFYEAMWADHPVLHILGHWNHEAGSSREVAVFTNCADVELLVNGRSLGPGASCEEEYPGIPHAPLVWKDVSFEAGALETRGRYGDRQLTDTRTTAGAPAMVTLAASNGTIIADGRDISYIDITVRDAEGNRCYASGGSVSIAVAGAAVLGGPAEVEAPAGLARVAIRSNGKAGDVTVTATGPGLDEGFLALKARQG